MRGSGDFRLRRFAAIDLHGRTGSQRRRRIVLAEFTVAALVGVVVGVALVVAGSAFSLVLGGYLIGIGANFLALLVASWQLLHSDQLDIELAGVDLGRERRRYSTGQARILVPFLLAFYLEKGGGE